MSRSSQLAALRKCQLTYHQRVKAGVLKAVLRCIDDHGTSCWASLSTLASESCFDRRTVIRSVNALEDLKILVAGRTLGKTKSYRIDFIELQKFVPETSDSGTLALVTTGHQPENQLVTRGHLTSDTGSATSDKGSPKANRSGIKRNTVAQVNEDFQKLWDLYPSRNGRKLEKLKALDEFLKLKTADIPLVMLAVAELAKSDQLPKDCFRWLRGGSWREWLPTKPETKKPAKPKLIGKGKALFDEVPA